MKKAFTSDGRGRQYNKPRASLGEKVRLYKGRYTAEGRRMHIEGELIKGEREGREHARGKQSPGDLIVKNNGGAFRPSMTFKKQQPRKIRSKYSKRQQTLCE